jgi:hypothetical protein
MGAHCQELEEEEKERRNGEERERRLRDFLSMHFALSPKV